MTAGVAVVVWLGRLLLLVLLLAAAGRIHM
jgi:hypothetical protein